MTARAVPVVDRSPSKHSHPSLVPDPTASLAVRHLPLPSQVPSPPAQHKTNVAGCPFQLSVFRELPPLKHHHSPSELDVAAFLLQVLIPSTRVRLMMMTIPHEAHLPRRSPEECLLVHRHFDVLSPMPVQVRMVELLLILQASHLLYLQSRLGRAAQPLWQLTSKLRREVVALPLHNLKNRQARNQSPESLLTIPFLLEQVKVAASTGLSSLDPEPRVPSPRIPDHLSLLSRPAAASPFKLMTVLRASAICRYLQQLCQLLGPHQSPLERSQMPSRSVF
jgi:hypothetical protein